MEQNFRTKFGHNIPFVKGFREKHPQVSARDVLYGDGNTSYIVNEYQFSKDLFEFLLMLDFLRPHRSSGAFESMLDLGGEEGTVARFFKVTGWAKHSTCIEMRDLKNCLPTDLFMKYCVDFQADREALINGRSLSETKITKHFADLSKEFWYSPLLGSSCFSSSFQGSPELDSFLCKDFYTHTGQYDLVTALLCLSWFDLDQIFAKVQELLSIGGIFFFIADYWWWPVNSTSITGDFPYTCQRLCEEDLIRYFSTYYPDKVDDVMERYRYFHKGKIHPTVSDYICAAYKAGLTLVDGRRIMPRTHSHPRTPYAPAFLESLKGNILGEVLNDIHYFRPGIQREDLQTSFVALAFAKMAPPQDSLEEALARTGSSPI